MIDIRYFLARQKTAQKAVDDDGALQQKESPAPSPARQEIPPWAPLRYLGLPDEPPPDEPAFDRTTQNHLEGCGS